MRLINADTIVHWQAYDDETESHPEHTGTIAELLDQITDEGCPEPVGAVSMVDVKKLTDYLYAYGTGDDHETTKMDRNEDQSQDVHHH